MASSLSVNQEGPLKVAVHGYDGEEVPGVLLDIDVNPTANIMIHMRSVEEVIRLGQMIEKKGRELAVKIISDSPDKETIEEIFFRR